MNGFWRDRLNNTCSYLHCAFYTYGSIVGAHYRSTLFADLNLEIIYFSYHCFHLYLFFNIVSLIFLISVITILLELIFFLHVSAFSWLFLVSLCRSFVAFSFSCYFRVLRTGILRGLGLFLRFWVCAMTCSLFATLPT